MASDSWPLVPVGEVCTIYDGPHATPSKTVSGPIFLGISNLVNGRLDLDEVEHLSEDDFIAWTRRVTPQPSDVVFSYETRLGEAALIPNDLRCCLGRRMALMRADTSKVDPRYLLYAYLGPEFQEVLRSRTIHGSTVDRIPLIEFPAFPIRVPPLAEQRAIAHILGALDDKIALNRQMNATLDAIAHALFKSWFIDFDPARARAEGHQPAGMDTEIAALFPSEFQQSEIGTIPLGWDVLKLGEVISLEYGKALKEDVRQPGHVPVFGSNGQVGWHNEALVPGPGIVVGRKGNPGIVTWAHTDFFPIDTTFFVRPREDMHFMRFWFYALSALGMGHLGSDSAVPGLNRNIAYMTPVLVPPRDVMKAFEQQTAAFVEYIFTNDMECETLATIRDALLPKLISGKVRVKAAEGVVAEALA